MLYTISFFFLIFATGRFQKLYKRLLLIVVLVLFFLRDRWLPYVPFTGYIYDRLPSSFSNDIEEGFSSNDFDLSGNVTSGDSRAGLDEVGKREVSRIMQRNKVGFDEARRVFTEKKFAKNNIGPDGRPRDPKFVSFS